MVEGPEIVRAIVAYGRRARTICELTPAREYEKLAKSLDRIRTIWGTNITAGMKRALKLLPANCWPCQVILLTDGHHNAGPRPFSTANLLKEIATCECIGIGGRPGDVDEVLMKEIASTRPDGTKRYRWIGDSDGLIQTFDELGGNLARQ